MENVTTAATNTTTKVNSGFWANNDHIQFEDELDYFLTKACYHEAAHLAVLNHFGGVGFIRIQKVENATRFERPVIGQVAYIPESLPAKHTHLVGLAGDVAEYLLLDPELDSWDMYEYLETEQMSESDLELAGDNAVLISS